VRSAWRRVATPAAVWIAFNVNLALWHVPALYELTLRDQAIHDLEHLSFLLLAVLFWAQVIDSPPLRSRLDRPRQVAYVVLGATACWLLALVLAIAPSALYAGYAAGHGHAGGLSALSDQQLAAGIMLGPGSVPYALFVFVALYRWLALPTRDASPSLTPEQRSLQRDGARAAPGGSGAGAAARAIRS
jgi:cytochrome c oxidase assembly factor CtaG